MPFRMLTLLFSAVALAPPRLRIKAPMHVAHPRTGTVPSAEWLVQNMCPGCVGSMGECTTPNWNQGGSRRCARIQLHPAGSHRRLKSLQNALITSSNYKYTCPSGFVDCRTNGPPHKVEFKGGAFIHTNDARCGWADPMNAKKHRPTKPSYHGSPTMGWTVSPALPSGMTFDQQSGTISGCPKRPIKSSVFQVSAFNMYGAGSTYVSIRKDSALHRFASGGSASSTATSFVPLRLSYPAFKCKRVMHRRRRRRRRLLLVSQNGADKGKEEEEEEEDGCVLWLQQGGGVKPLRFAPSMHGSDARPITRRWHNTHYSCHYFVHPPLPPPFQLDKVSGLQVQ
jgi:hypothetical protein